MKAVQQNKDTRFLKFIFFWQFLIFKKRGSKELSLGENICNALEELGTIYIKIGQFVATRPDLVSEEITSKLSRLQTNITPFSQAEIKQHLEQIFDNKFSDIFENLSDPVASASIAQIHKAKLKSNGRDVALKIVLPKHRKNVLKQCKKIIKLAAFFDGFKSLQRFQIKTIIAEFSNQLQNECDLINEASSYHEFTEICKDNKLEIYTPEIFWQYSKESVLVMSWIDGHHISKKHLQTQFSKSQRNEIAKHILKQFIVTCLYGGFFHADIHQGNIIIDENQKIYFIDFGITENLSWNTRFHLTIIMSSLIQQDFKKAAIAHKMAGYIDKDVDINHFSAYLRSIFNDIHGKPIGELDSFEILQRLFATTKIFGMKAQPQLVKLQKTMLTIEGMLKQIDPDLDYLEVSLPIINKYLKCHHGPKIIKEIVSNSSEYINLLADNKNNFLKIGRLLSDDNIINLLQKLGQSHDKKINPFLLVLKSFTFPIIITILLIAIYLK